MSQNDLSHALREMRVAARPRMSQSDLAERLGVTHQAISNIERGVSVPSTQILKAWADACGRSVAFVRSDARSWLTSLPEDDERLVAVLYRVLPKIGRERRADLEALLMRWERELFPDAPDDIV